LERKYFGNQSCKENILKIRVGRKIFWESELEGKYFEKKKYWKKVFCKSGRKEKYFGNHSWM
jgi:hypothetical protein